MFLYVRHHIQRRCHLVNAYEVKAGMVFFAGEKLCDPCLSARHCTSALIYLLPLHTHHADVISVSKHVTQLGMQYGIIICCQPQTFRPVISQPYLSQQNCSCIGLANFGRNMYKHVNQQLAHYSHKTAI